MMLKAEYVYVGSNEQCSGQVSVNRIGVSHTYLIPARLADLISLA